MDNHEEAVKFIETWNTLDDGKGQDYRVFYAIYLALKSSNVEIPSLLSLAAFSFPKIYSNYQETQDISSSDFVDVLYPRELTEDDFKASKCFASLDEYICLKRSKEILEASIDHLPSQVAKDNVLQLVSTFEQQLKDIFEKAMEEWKKKKQQKRNIPKKTRKRAKKGTVKPTRASTRNARKKARKEQDQFEQELDDYIQSEPEQVEQEDEYVPSEPEQVEQEDDYVPSEQEQEPEPETMSILAMQARDKIRTDEQIKEFASGTFKKKSLSRQELMNNSLGTPRDYISEDQEKAVESYQGEAFYRK